MDPDHALFVIGLQDARKKLIFEHNFFRLILLKVHLHHFSKIKSQKESQNSRNQGFSYYFCMLIEGSGRPENMWIREAQKHVDPVNPDPQHCIYLCVLLLKI
jgi:hypothetical protein